MRKCLVVAAVALIACSGCAAPEQKDYSLFHRYMPRSILILPPINESTENSASAAYLSIASQAVGDKGFYVFPVAVVDTFLRENGVPDPADMHAIPLARIDEFTGADAVLYLTLEQFGQKFEGLGSTTRVRTRGRLVDVDSGQELWQNTVDHQNLGDRGNASGNVLNALMATSARQSLDNVSDSIREEARQANYRLVTPTGRGLLYGPRHPLHGSDRADR